MLSDHPIFTWKSKSTQNKEAIEYEKWAFPYGEEQRKRLEALLGELFPKADLPSLLISFLTCKEIYEGVFDKEGSEEAAASYMINEVGKYKMVLRKKEMPMYIAIVLADERVDGSFWYQSADEIRAKAQQLEALRIDKKASKKINKA